MGRGGLVRDDCEGDDRRQGREGRAEPYHKEERRYEGAAAATGSELKKVFATLFYLFLKIFWFLAFLWPKLHLTIFFQSFERKNSESSFEMGRKIVTNLSHNVD